MGIKIAITFSFLLSLGALGGSGYLYQALNAEIREREALELSQAQVEEKALNFEEVTEQYQSEIDRMRGQLKEYAADRKTFQEEIQKSREEILALQEKLQEQLGKIAAPVQEVVEQVSAPVEEFASEATGLVKEKTFIVDRGTVTEVKETVTETTTTSSLAAATDKKFQVMTVNRKFNFVVVNLGLEDNLKIGDRLVLERGGANVGNVQVEKLYDTFAAATILDESGTIQEGDIVRFAT